MDLNASFEDEILSINPEYDLIFSNYDETRLNLSPHLWEPRRKCSPQRMKIISKMNQIIGIKPVGELPTHNDWEDTECVETETIAMMRNLGLESSSDQPPDEKRTISTVPINDDVIIMRNGHKKMSVFMSDAYFELKPRSEPSFEEEDDEENAEETSRSDLSDISYVYAPISHDTTKETEETSISDESFDNAPRKETAHVKSRFDKNRKSAAEGNVDQCWRIRSKVPEVGRENNRGSVPRSKRNSYNETSRNSSWWRSGSSNSETRNENHWRKSVEEREEPSLQMPRSVAKPIPEPVSNCGSPLFKPKELFMRRRARMIQQVLAENQSQV